MFLRKNGRIEKIEIRLQLLLQKNNPFLLIGLPSEVQKLFTPHQFFLIRPPSNIKRDEAQKTKQSIVPRHFLHILVYTNIYCEY